MVPGMWLMNKCTPWQIMHSIKVEHKFDVDADLRNGCEESRKYITSSKNVHKTSQLFGRIAKTK